MTDYTYVLVLQMPAGLHNSAPTFKQHIEHAWSVNASYIELPSTLLSVFQMTMYGALCYLSTAAGICYNLAIACKDKSLPACAQPNVFQLLLLLP